MFLKDLRKATRETLQELRDAEWFSNVGRPLPEVPGWSFRRVRSWARAFDSATGGWWPMVNYTHAVDLEEVATKKKFVTRWRAAKNLLNVPAHKLATTKAGAVPDIRFPVEASNLLGYQVAHILLEKEFEESIPPDFFLKIGYWLCEGYYPCGQSADGHLVIY
ncbi:MAG TPA: hypothetical protein PKD86_04610 [Gemmatales bacterium]|nr:hypothetical protein [Gemmatales bacterium]HMP58614.1 hypothetical protein [Gemmatales bacterium]